MFWLRNKKIDLLSTLFSGGLIQERFYSIKTLLIEKRDTKGYGIKGLIWPPLEPKTENCFSPISFDWFIRRITEV